MEIKKSEEFLLDLFAKDAMNALIPFVAKLEDVTPEQDKALAMAIAEGAYNIAEAMLEERRKRIPEPKQN